jgi:hypothetical protein
MDGNPRIVIADRSELAANIYELLLSPLGVSLVVRRRFEEARPHFFRREAVKLALFNSNVFGKKYPEIIKHLVEDEPLRSVQKIFICREIPAEVPWRERLLKLPNAQVIMRPFHPDEFVALVKKAIE